AVLPLLKDGGSVVAMDFDNSISYPIYDWMGVAKSALTSTARYLARYLGEQQVRVNLVSAGPLRTVAARSIPGFDELAKHWPERAPLGWVTTDPEPAAKAVVALLSDWLPATTGEIVHVDGGFHSTGACAGPPRAAPPRPRSLGAGGRPLRRGGARPFSVPNRPT